MSFKKREKKTNLVKRLHEEESQDPRISIQIDKLQLNQQRQRQNSQSQSRSESNMDILSLHFPQSPPIYQLQKASEKEEKLKFLSSEINDIACVQSESRGLLERNRDNAYRSLEVDTETDRDAFERAKQRIEISNGIRDGTLDPKVYRGLNGYANYFAQTYDDLRQKKFSGTLGPVRAPTFIRNTTRVDYNPERCKDYYESGYCAFGDSCIFIHDRGDYKSGWELDKEWEEEQRKKQMKLLGKGVDEEDENYEIHSQCSDSAPTFCPICESPFLTPIVTVCGHYFCEKCALAQYSESDACFSCGKPTSGIFNEAKALHQKKKKEGGKGEEGQEGEESEGSHPTTQVTKKEVDVDSDEGGLISKEEKLIMQEYLNGKSEKEGSKYVGSNGWVIP